jgi:nicotinate-nucleotide adenylyltransferase
LRRIGLLGGTFDPPHVGHLWLATLARDVLGLERVLVIPAAQPPHKLDRRVSPVEDRVAMVRAAIEDDPALELSTIEMERAGPSYTVDLVDALRERLGADTEPTLIMAGDSLADILANRWREPDRLLASLEWAVGPRPGAERTTRAAITERFGAAGERIHLLDGPALDVSGTEIRARVAAGRTIRYLVPPRVEAEIAARGLYAPESTS